MARNEENAKRLRKEWYERNKELTKQRAKQWAADNPEKAAVKKAKWRSENREMHNAINREWFAQNKDKRAAYEGKRRAAQLQRTPSWLTEDDLWIIEQAYELAEIRTKMFNFPWHVDHIIPLQGKQVSGMHHPLNIQVIPAKENLSKSNKHSV
jgi:hypothetical protein